MFPSCKYDVYSSFARGLCTGWRTAPKAARPDGAEALSPGQHPGFFCSQTCRPVRAKALTLLTIYKASALTGRLADFHSTQGAALGYAVLPLPGEQLLERAFSPYITPLRNLSKHHIYRKETSCLDGENYRLINVCMVCIILYQSVSHCIKVYHFQIDTKW